MRQYELDELTKIYEDRGLPEHLAKEVAMHLTKNDGEQLLLRPWLLVFCSQKGTSDCDLRILILRLGHCTHAVQLSAARPKWEIVTALLWLQHCSTPANHSRLLTLSLSLLQF